MLKLKVHDKFMVTCGVVDRRQTRQVPGKLDLRVQLLPTPTSPKLCPAQPHLSLSQLLLLHPLHDGSEVIPKFSPQTHSHGKSHVQNNPPCTANKS
jgi:hypothetical protein